jgi:hypothetical protein
MARLPAIETRERSLLVGEFATVSSGIFGVGLFFLAPDFLAADFFARDGATRVPSRSPFAKCGGHGASPSPAAVVARSELEQRLERTRRGVDPGMADHLARRTARARSRR